jgi:hypothetical protein
VQWALVGGLGEAGAAALLALLCIAVSYMLVAIGKAIEATSIPIVSSGLAKIWNTITHPVVSWLVGATDELWSDAEWWMRNISVAFDWMWDDIKGAFATDAAFISHLFISVIPGAAEHAISGAASYVNQEISTLHRDISEATTAIEKAATADAARALAKAEGFAGTIKADLTKIVAHDLTHAETYADNAAAAVKGWAEGAIGAIHIPDITGVEAGLAALTGTVAGIAAAVAAVTTEVETCAVTTCDGPNNLQGLLNGILGLSGLVAFGEFLQQVINDPAGAEAEYAGIFQGLVGTGTDALDALLSL